MALVRVPFYFINVWLITYRHRYCTYLYYSLSNTHTRTSSVTACACATVGEEGVAAGEGWGGEARELGERGEREDAPGRRWQMV